MDPKQENPRPSVGLSRRVGLIAPSATKEMGVLAGKIGELRLTGSGCSLLPHSAAYRGGRLPGHQRRRRQREIHAPAGHAPPASGRCGKTGPGQRTSHFDPETEIGITVGAMEGLLAAILTVVDRGDEVIMPSPCYASHIEQVLLAEGAPVFVPLREDDWGLDLERYHPGRHAENQGL